MNEQKAKVRLTVGQTEIEYEGDPASLQANLAELIKKVSEILKSHPIASEGSANNKDRSASATGGQSLFSELSPEQVRRALEAENGADFAFAAAVYLRLAKGKRDFQKKELRPAMKEMEGFSTTRHGNSLSSSLNTLKKYEKLIIPRKDYFSIPPKELERAQALVETLLREQS